MLPLRLWAGVEVSVWQSVTTKTKTEQDAGEQQPGFSQGDLGLLQNGKLTPLHSLGLKPDQQEVTLI